MIKNKKYFSIVLPYNVRLSTSIMQKNIKEVLFGYTATGLIWLKGSYGFQSEHTLFEGKVDFQSWF